jgi:hypothetical protein
MLDSGKPYGRLILETTEASIGQASTRQGVVRMTATVTEPTETVAPEATKPSVLDTFLASANDFERNVYSEVKTDVDKFNELAAQYTALGGDANELLVNLRETSQTPDVVKIRENIAALNDALLELETKRDEILKSEVAKVQEQGAGSAEAVAAELDEIKIRVSPLIDYLAGRAKVKPDELGLKLARRANRSGGVRKAGTTGGRKVRGYNVSVNGKLATLPNGSGQSSNMAAAAKVIGVETSVIQQKFWNECPQGKDTPVESFPETEAFEVVKGDETFKVTMVKIPAGAE